MWSRCWGLVERKVWIRPRRADHRGPRQAADGALGDDLGNAPHGVEVAIGGDGKSGLDDVDAHLLQDLGQLELFLDGHGGAGRLLAVAHGGVEDDDVGARR
jgi:hypothetical protein